MKSTMSLQFSDLLVLSFAPSVVPAIYIICLNFQYILICLAIPRAINLTSMKGTGANLIKKTLFKTIFLLTGRIC